MTDGLLTTRQAAKHLGISPRRVRALIKAGRLPATKHGSSWAIKENDLELVKERPTGRPPKGAPFHVEIQDPPSTEPGSKVAYFIPSHPERDDS
jgi:excisionase family DNA binding protein